MAEQIIKDLAFFTPEIALTATLLAAVLTDLIFRRTRLAVAGVVLTGFVVTGILAAGQGGMHTSIFGNMIAVDPFAHFVKMVVLLTAILVTVFSLFSSELNSAGRNVGEYYTLLVGATIGLMLMAGASNLLMIYLAIELSSISSYILSGYMREAPDSSEASLKYVIFGALSSGLMLYGISVVYGLTGALDLYAINQALPGVIAAGGTSAFLLLIAGVLVTAGFGYKISAVPFHYWAPDVYEGAPITITAYLAVASKAAGFAVLIRFFKTAFIDLNAMSVPVGSWATFQGLDWVTLVAVLSVLTMTVGNLVAIWQGNLKRLLAYSSIAHAGYMLMGVVVLNNEGLTAILLYFVVYLVMNLGAFYVVMLVANKTGSEDIEDYRGLGARAPFMAFALAVFLISLTGIPPTGGFVGKLYLFAALINHGWVWLAIVGALNSVVSLYYYVRILRNMYLRGDEKPAAAQLKFSMPQTATALLLLVPTLLLGIYFAPLVQFAQASVKMFGTP